MLRSEEAIRDALNNAGCLAAEQALKQFDTDGSPIILGGLKLTSKGLYHKTYQTQWGEAKVDRHVYQSTQGGRHYCPLEKDARIFLTPTPGFVELLACQYAELGSSRALFDLQHCHGRSIARSYLKSIGDAVGAVAQAKEQAWTYAPPQLDKPVKSVSVGIDGTCMLLTEGGWRESMVGTISLYDGEGQRLHTIQMGATPEYGKKKFYGRFDQELSKVKERYPKASYVAITDGARDNWSYLSSRTDRQWVDFWHAVGYLGQAADALFSGKRQRVARKEWLDRACHRLKSQPGSATRLYNELREHLESRSFKKTDKEHLLASATHFNNNQSKMHYSRHQSDNLPIGSGVTEAACKTLVKQRLSAVIDEYSKTKLRLSLSGNYIAKSRLQVINPIYLIGDWLIFMRTPSI